MTCCGPVSHEGVAAGWHDAGWHDDGRPDMTIAPVPSRSRYVMRRPLPSRRIRRPMAAVLARQMARRRWLVAMAKRLLPVAALALLASVALWPELSRDSDRARLSYRRGAPPQSGQMTAATYHGVDTSGRPYTVTAATADQVGPERINLTDPKGDISLESGSWLMAQSRQGVYLQHLGSLDMSDDVHLYRDDGTTLTTSSASLDLKLGAAAGADLVHSEGPFGTLDAQGFAVTDRGAILQFTGPGRLILNSAQGHPPPANVDESGPPAPPKLQ
jgi:lipopolysaccharide export system protein LptC